jgi:hypothetical protein
MKNTPTEGSEANVTVKIGCCNRKISKKLSPANSVSLLNLMSMSDAKFQYIMKKIDEVKNEKIGEIYLDID